MAVLTDGQRRKRYARAQPTTGLVLSPPKSFLLQTVAEYKLVTLPQLALRSELPLKSTRRYMRQLFDHGLVDVVAVPRLALADIDAPNTPSLLYGSGPNVYVVTKAGVELLGKSGLNVSDYKNRTYGPRNLVFLAHELQIRSIRLWLDCIARSNTEICLERWEDGTQAELPLGTGSADGVVRPDAWCVLRFGKRVMVALIELDRATERGEVRWRQKIEGYGRLLDSTALLHSTGYSKARVLTVTPHVRRRDQLANLVKERAPSALAERFWFVARDDLEHASLTDRVWSRVGFDGLIELLSPDMLSEALEGSE